MKRACIAAALLGFATASCTQGGDQRICSAPETLERSMKKVDQRSETDKAKPGYWIEERVRNEEFAEACVHRWAYRLAKAGESAMVTTRGVLSACEVPIDHFHQAAIISLGMTRQIAGVEATEADYAELRRSDDEHMEKLALFHVMQAKAGHCPVPA